MNDNSETWISLAAAVANVVTWLSQKKENGAHEETGHSENRDDEAADRQLPVIR